MKNLKNYHVEELDLSNSKQTEGGVINFLIGGFLLGRRVEYMKNGGDFFDFYL
ncbi:hypothetical protein [Flagellimonas sediminis]|uniref:Uncharacterized protein n=1 Tax=Flagellimonas sediminis TaxID=2696468 RepID=A0A6I5KPM8_9FLAO|nr:hypothetical protein [Allomuricauda sediminis]NDV42844.1 hypothetical protein [Allomuricauda sediminis]